MRKLTLKEQLYRVTKENEYLTEQCEKLANRIVIIGIIYITSTIFIVLGLR